MLTLNLLPQHYQEEYILEKRKRFTVSFMISFCLIAVAFSALLFATYFILTIRENSLEAALASRRQGDTSKELSAIKDGVRSLNKKISELKAAEVGVVPLGPALERLTLLIRPGLYLKSVSIDALSAKVTVSGFADTREEVLSLGAALDASDFVKPGSLESPITNILKEKAVDFSFSFILNP